MDKRISLLWILSVVLLIAVLINSISAPPTESKVAIKDKKDEHIYVVPGTVFCVERTLGSKEKVNAVMAPLFSEGPTLESIDLKKVTVETYTVNVPDYGTCIRDVETAMNSTVECPSTCSYKNDTCVCTTEEKYSCITGYHQEKMVREVVSYVPLSYGSYDKDKSDKNDKEKEVEGYRGMLPEKLKGLKHVGYSNEFEVENDATIRMCFRAPEWDSEIKSGVISYLAYASGEQDYESSTAWDFYSYRMRINCSGLTDGIPIVINSSNGFSSLHGQNCGKQIVWTYCSGINTSLYYNSCSDYEVWNNSNQLPMEIEQGTGTSYNPTQVWGAYADTVYHFYNTSGQTINDSSNAVHNAGCQAGNCNFTKNTYSGTFGLSCNRGLSEWAKQNSTTWPANQNMTVFLIVESENQGGVEVIVSRAKLASQQQSIYEGYYSANTWGTIASLSGSSITRNAWYFVTEVFNGTHDRLYINDSVDIVWTSFSYTSVAYSTILCAQLEDSIQRYFSGIIDELRIYNRTFSLSEINQTYQNAIGTAGFGNLGAEETSGGGQQGGNGTEAVIESDSGSIVLSPASGGKVKFMASLTDGSNEVSIANMKAAYEHIAQDLLESISDWQGQCSSCVGAGDINANEVQKKVQSTCNSSQAIYSITVDGATNCVNVSGGGGGIGSCSDCNSNFVNEGQADSITSGMVAFNYATSNTEGGAATDLDCGSSCVSNSEISEMTWSKLQSYPDACSSGQFATRVTDTDLGCATPSGVSCSSCDSNFVNVGGDNMSGDLVMGNYKIKDGNNHIWVRNSSSSKMELKSTGWIEVYYGAYSCAFESIEGSFSCTGTKNAEIYVPEINETVYMHAIEGDEVLHVMKGTAKLESGKLTVVFPENFQYIISESSIPNVQVTPLGKCNLYVSDKKWNTFTVESFGGVDDCQFDWIVFATRRGYDGVGMEKSGVALDTASYCSSQKKIEEQECIKRFDNYKNKNG